VNEVGIEEQILILERRIAYWERMINSKKVRGRDLTLTHIVLDVLQEQLRNDRDRISKNLLT
jgi:hypothetical protein